MTYWLKEDTAATVKMGPFIDEDDGKTSEDGLAIGQADIRLSKNGGNFAQSANAAGGTFDEDGWYGIPLDTTDTNTAGSLLVYIHEAGALPVWKYFEVLPSGSYDGLITTGLSTKEDVADATWDEILGGHVGAGSTGAALTDIETDVTSILADQITILESGTSDSGNTTTMVDAARTEADDDYWNGAWIRFTSGNIAGQVRLITDFDEGSDTITFTPATTQAVDTHTYQILPAAAITSIFGDIGGSVVGDVQGDVDGSVASVTGAVGSVTGAVGSVTGAVGSVAGNVDGNVTGNVTGTVASVNGNVDGNVTGNVTGNVDGTVASVTGNVDGNVTGSVGSVAGAVGSVTGAVGSVTGAVGSVAGNVDGNVSGSTASVVGAVGSVAGNVDGNVGGNVTGSVGSVVGAVGSVTGAVGSVTGAVGSVTGNVGGNVTGTVASVVGNLGGNVVGNLAGDVQGNVDGSVASVTALSAAAVDQILDEVVEGTTTFRETLRAFMAALANKATGGGTLAIAFRDVADTKDRIAATVDVNGNRTAVTLDLT